MKKITSIFSKMKPKDWLMVSLWALTLIFLFAFVGTVTGLSKEAGKTKADKPAHWSFELSKDGEEKIKVGGSVTAMPTKIYKTKEEAMDDKTTHLSDKHADWTFKELVPGTPSKNAESANNSIAAVAFIFFLSLTAAIFTTAFIKFKDRKAGK